MDLVEVEAAGTDLEGFAREGTKTSSESESEPEPDAEEAGSIGSDFGATTRGSGLTAGFELTSLSGVEV